MKLIDLHSRTTQQRRIVFEDRWSLIGPHSIKIKALDEHVDLDAFVVLD